MYHLHKRGTVYWLKMRVPADVQPLLPPRSSKWVQESLRTNDERQAKRRRDIRVAELETRWEDLRRANNIPVQYLTPAELQGAVRLRENLKAYHGNSTNREEMLGLIQDVVEDVHIEDVGDPFVRSDKAAEFHGIATGETVFLKDAAETFLNNTKLKPSTVALYRTVLKQVASSMPFMEDVTRDRAREFLQTYARTRTVKALNNLLSAAKTLWRHMGLDDSVWQGHRVEAGKDTKPKGVFSSEELKKLLTTASNRDPRLYDAIVIAAHAGLRRQEVCGLVYDAELDQLVVTKEKSKNSHPRRVPVHDAIRDNVRRFVQSQQDRPLNTKNLSNLFRELMILVEIPRTVDIDGQVYKRDFHALRHTFASKLTEAGVEVAVIGRILGHKPVNQVTLRYAGKADPEKLRQHIEKLWY